jgi:hypothetical protein
MAVAHADLRFACHPEPGLQTDWHKRGGVRRQAVGRPPIFGTPSHFRALPTAATLGPLPEIWACGAELAGTADQPTGNFTMKSAKYLMA